MNYFRRPEPGPEEPVTTQDAPRSAFAEVAGRFANWITGADRFPEAEPNGAQPLGHDPIRELSLGADDPDPSVRADAPDPSHSRTEGTDPSHSRTEGADLSRFRAEDAEPSRFPPAPFGYNRAAVDEHLSGLERELSELRAERAPALSITEELEKIGEQTASILVVAHDQAHETTRLAQEQADRCVADAAANAVAITAEARQRLSELDSETDSVWRERERLLEDVRVVSAALATLADEASQRFPAAEPAERAWVTSSAQSARGVWGDSAPQSGEGVWGESAPQSGEGVWGESAPQSGEGVWGESAPQSGEGVWGESAPQSGEGVWGESARQSGEGTSPASEPQPTEPFGPLDVVQPPDQRPERASQTFPRATQPGDTGSWLTGLEPPESPMQ